ncbi:type II toxin-antitoxin system RelE family toxin [Treponema pedis]|uniref:type II toxin-antitoxin system RelE family toxin n=1 Tax=Treponema pedis TaxID=409322 RepID=UPI0004212A51|nr:type II toxin-antitoxin system RelE/ParE family toxin [Treponema pedis]
MRFQKNSEYDSRFNKCGQKNLKALDKTAAKEIIKYLREIERLENPKIKGKSLKGNLSGLWRYRVMNYRILCRILEDKMIIYVIKIGHRKDVYSRIPVQV